jgi:3-oxoacyl-[acyl-carrier-protein] synthase II
MMAMEEAIKGKSDFKLVSVNAHATSTKLGDEIELQALEKIIPDPGSVSVISNKGSIGHLLGASGAVESIFAIQSLQQGFLPANLNLCTKIPTSFNLPTQNSFISPQIQNPAILKTSFGFGGVNVALLFKKYTD